MEAWERAVAYHERTKHSLQRYARGPGELHWANQPDPFRRYVGAPLTLLSLARDDDSPTYESLYAPPHSAARDTAREGLHAPARSAARDSLSTPCAPARPLNFDSISRFFELSLAISAWKEFKGTRWALRCNPSSGNLHPTEGYVILPALDGLHGKPAVYHYAPREHGLERRAELDETAWTRLISAFPPRSFLVGLSSIQWREAWKYGERAYRYCQHDVGHAIAALRFAAAALGWRMKVLDGAIDAQVAALLGLDQGQALDDPDREHPDLLAVVTPGRTEDPPTSLPPRIPSEVVADFAGAKWHGRANRLSAEHVEWEAIDAVARACAKLAISPACETDSTGCDLEEEPLVEASQSRRARTARDVIRSRRSAVAYDGTTRLAREQFFLMLSRTLPRGDRAPWDALGAPTAIHLLLMVHLVDGMAPGLYSLVREGQELDALKAAMRGDFLWSPAEAAPHGLPLYLLMAGDARRAATAVSCHQFIAGQGAFSFGMAAPLRRLLIAHGAWMYRRIFWEAGLLGQVMYLEAEAAGLRATGIGCYFDDAVHDLFGLRGGDYQSMYHFTVGAPVEDARLTTRPAYDRER